MSRVSISRSYAVLVGLEAYVKTRKKIKHGVEHVSNVETKVVHPEAYQRKLEEEKDKSKSAEREREILAAKAEKQEAVERESSWRRKIWSRIRTKSISSKDELKQAKEHRRKKVLSKSGEDAESAIPPSGHRDT
jgi:lysyl-tRNA synthetase class I